MIEGEIIAGKYRLDAVLGEGAMGVVYRATQLDLDRDVAVKVLHANLAARGDARARFVREAKVAAALHHPGAVRVLDFGEHAAPARVPDRVPSLRQPSGPVAPTPPPAAAAIAEPATAAHGELYLVMERLVGGTLRARLEAGPDADHDPGDAPDGGALPLPLALELARQIASVLEAAHRINLVHRDIKPENVFLEGDAAAPRAIVVDFGLAFIADAQGSVGRLTDAGILGGTPAYMSPEQARGKAVGPSSDVYSLGCTLYELLAGRPPFIGAVSEMIARHAFAPPLTLRDLGLVPPMPAALDELVVAMLSKSPPLRPTAAQVVERLEALALEVADAAEGGVPGSRSLRTVDRASRVLARPGVATVEMALDDPTAVVLAVAGELDDELRLGLATSLIRVVAADDPAAAAVFAPGATPARLAALCAGPRPVLTDVVAGDFAALAACVRVGCHDAVTRPVRAADLARKVRRAALGRPGPVAEEP